VTLFMHLFVSLNNILSFLFVLGVYNVGAGALAGSEGVSNDEKTLLNYLEQVRYAKVLVGLLY
jgi:hypothetical protein